eukprot:41167_1
MANCGIVVVIEAKVISTMAIFFKDKDIRRATLQFLDLLIFEEIYESHKKVVSQIKSKKSVTDKETAIESTLSFKYVRNYEAVFESIPQSVLQLVFIMRDSTSNIRPIFILSIIQSVISMTNSIINNDYTQMQDDKWKRYKKRFPPTFEFFKHALSRLSEVAHRIGLLSLFWCVCGGWPFGIMVFVEFCLICARMLKRLKEEHECATCLSFDTLLLNLNTLIVVPSEMVYFGEPVEWYTFCVPPDDNWEPLVPLNLCCCAGLASFFISFGSNILGCRCNTPTYTIPTFRIGTSFNELMIVIFYGVFHSIFMENGGRAKFLWNPEHGLYIFIATCVCFLIYTQYLLLFPDFTLPLDINVLSKWNYAFSNELSELQKMKIPAKFENHADFWDESCTNHTIYIRPITAATFALANGNHHIASWLEQHGAKRHLALKMDKCTCLARLAMHMDDVDMEDVSQTLRKMIEANRCEHAMELMRIGATLTEQIVRSGNGNTDSLLSVMSHRLRDANVNYHWFKVFKRVVLADPSCIDKKHILHPLELELCKNDNHGLDSLHVDHFIHFIVSLTSEDLVSHTTVMLQQFIKDGKVSINSERGGESALHCIMKKEKYTDIDVQNARVLIDGGFDVYKGLGFDVKVFETHESKENVDGMAHLLLSPGKLLHVMTLSFVNGLVSVIPWLHTLQMIMKRDPNCMDKEHLLYPLKHAYEQGGGSIHLAIAMTRIETENLANPYEASITILRTIVRNQGNDVIIQTDRNGHTALDLIVQKDPHTINAADITNIRFLIAKAGNYAFELPVKIKAQEIIQSYNGEQVQKDDNVYSFVFERKPFGVSFGKRGGDKMNLYVTDIDADSPANGLVIVGSKVVGFENEYVEDMGAKKIFKTFSGTYADALPLKMTFRKPEDDGISKNTKH